jgi:hypothetical protein
VSEHSVGMITRLVMAMAMESRRNQRTRTDPGQPMWSLVGNPCVDWASWLGRGGHVYRCPPAPRVRRMAARSSGPAPICCISCIDGDARHLTSEWLRAISRPLNRPARRRAQIGMMCEVQRGELPAIYVVGPPRNDGATPGELISTGHGATRCRRKAEHRHAGRNRAAPPATRTAAADKCAVIR